VNPDCGYFFLVTGLAHPDSGQPGDALRRDAEVAKRVDKNLLDPANEGSYIAFPLSQIHDRICHDLAGSVISDIAAPVRLVQFYAGPPERFRRCQQIFFMPVAADGNHVRMFDEQQTIHAEALFTLRRDPVLNLQRIAIRHATEIAHQTLARHPFTIRQAGYALMARPYTLLNASPTAS